METQVINSNTGTQILPDPTRVIGKPTTDSGSTFTGGLLRLGEAIDGWEVRSKLNTVSGEADIYIAEKNGEKGIIKYYRSTTSPKTDILEKLKGLKHADIVNLNGFGMYNNRFYEIMEYAAGGSLDTRNKDGAYRYLPLSEEEVIGICREMISAFKTCHAAGIIHRDIKPANIYFRNVEETETGEDEEKKTVYKGSDAVIADFGISSIMDEAEQLHKTRTGSRTTGYAAPEVLSGIIGPKMDYYALGVTLWELLTGKDPFTLENGTRYNDAYLIRETIEGRIADEILSKEPRVSRNMERLIRGLLVIDPDYRWGYDEVTRHLAGETVEIYQQKKKDWTFSIGGAECSTLEELGVALLNNPEEAKKYVFKGLLASFLENVDPKSAKDITEIAEEASAAKDLDNGVLKAAYSLSPGMPLKVDNGFAVQNRDDLIFLLEKAPESVVPLLRDPKSKLHTWLGIIGSSDTAEEIRALPPDISDTEFAGKAEVLLRNKVIKPFKLARYEKFELSTLDQLRNVPSDMQRRILTLVKEKSYEGLFLPWLDIISPDLSVNDMDISGWKNFINWDAAKHRRKVRETSEGT
ncbi:MAG: serine/threonine protein kinase [Treponema sp.]|jgi:serine/threonine protein kinase|nr:serine/threonine protein kinase [Treponema sp.]